MFGKQEESVEETTATKETEVVTETKEESPVVKSTGGYPDGELDYMK